MVLPSSGLGPLSCYSCRATKSGGHSNPAGFPIPISPSSIPPTRTIEKPAQFDPSFLLLLSSLAEVNSPCVCAGGLYSLKLQQIARGAQSLKVVKKPPQMMPGVCISSSLAASANGGSCGAVTMVGSDVRLLSKNHMKSIVIGSSLQRQGLLRLHPTSSSRMRRMSSRVKATWPFKGHGKKMDAHIEQSEAANEDILIFFFQLDLETRIQYALNMEQYEAAKQLRNKLDEVETEIIKQREAKRGSTKSEAQDKALNLLRLRGDMQKAVEDENYAVAAELRDEISKLEAETLAASAKALAHENMQYAFRLGQKVRHKKFGYRAVICGMDPVCCESRSWMETARVDKLLQGPYQPFYQVLVDVNADPNLLVAYVAEENLSASEQPDMDSFDHPYASFLFYGVDTAGDFIPIKQLRQKYSRPRHEVPADMHDEDGDGNF